MILLSIDPGKSTGWAAFSDAPRVWVLYKCGKWDGDNPRVHADIGLVDRCVIEMPRRYPGGVGGKDLDPQDLLVLARRAGFVAGRALSSHTTTLPEWVYPSDWKGNVPKSIHHPRIRRALSQDEQHIAKGVGPDTWDAIGLGLWACGRMGRGA